MYQFSLNNLYINKYITKFHNIVITFYLILLLFIYFIFISSFYLQVSFKELQCYFLYRQHLILQIIENKSFCYIEFTLFFKLFFYL